MSSNKEENMMVRRLAEMETEEIEKKISSMDYMVQRLSSFDMGKDAQPELLEEMDEILEAHFFCEEAYIHLYEYDGELWVSELQEAAAEEMYAVKTESTAAYKKGLAEAMEKNLVIYQDEEQLVRNGKSSRNGGNDNYMKLTLRRYVEFDEDGQAYFAGVRPVKLS